MTQTRRCDDEKQAGFWPALSRFFSHGVMKIIITGLLVAGITWLATTLWTLPANYARTEALSKLADKQITDWKAMDDKKLDTKDYVIAHQALIDNMNAHFTYIENTQRDSKDDVKEIKSSVKEIRDDQIRRAKKESK
jgi:biopolymer transport protein ExbB/TolQ